MSSSSAFDRLDPRIQHFLWREGWQELRDAQEQAIPLILSDDTDVIVAAATAAGKTEAAFLPALTRMLQSETVDGQIEGLIVYVSPLKALINDQFGRLERLCADLGVPVWPWHGDVSSSTKARFLRDPRGVLLITPEAVEATLCNRGTSVAGLFAGTLYFVIDELHAFLGSERGKQVQSLLHRVERAVGRTIPRIGLSATLGDMALAAEFLRPGGGQAVRVVESRSESTSLRILVRGYAEPAAIGPAEVQQDGIEDDDGDEVGEPVAGIALSDRRVAASLFQALRGSNNLVFPNSRRQVELYTHLLATLCTEARVPNEFWPHHGSLSRDIREETEAALKQRDLPATAICTTTLELGIDIGAVKSVAQIGPPPSVASLRQRLGRSGRRQGEPAILRGFAIEAPITEKSSLASQLRLDLAQTAAMILLLLQRWFEPPLAQGLHLSTLVQQLLSVIAQRGGVTAGEAWSTLCGPRAPFAGLGADAFKDLLRHLAAKDLIVQDDSGVLLHGRTGEALVNHYTFYAAFTTDEEFRLVAGTKTLGTLPVVQMLGVGQQILFAGKTWRVEEVDERGKTIYVTRTRGGAPPLFSGGGGRVHTRVRQQMRELLAGTEDVGFLDDEATRLLQQGRETYARLGLGGRALLADGSYVRVLTWLGDAANEALACLLNHRGCKAWAAGPGVEIPRSSASARDVEAVLRQVAANPAPELGVLLAEARNLEREKWDWALPAPLLQRAYASLHLDLAEAMTWLRARFGEGGRDAASEAAGGW